MHLSHAALEADQTRYSGHPVELPSFQGPLDLLLHLIKRDQIEIWEISISRITHQYLEYLATLRSLNIEVAGEFLVMAATLMRIKSQNLLPRPSFLADGEEGEAPVTREQLIARLVEYRKYREAARALSALETLQRRMHGSGSVVQLDSRATLPLREPRLFDLAEYLRELLSRGDSLPRHEVHLEEIKLEEQLEWIQERLALPFDWEALPEGASAESMRGIRFERFLRRPGLRLEVAVTFLAILELAKGQLLRLWQKGALEPIWILARGRGTQPFEAQGWSPDKESI